MKVCRPAPKRYRMINNVGPWQPVPGFDFELPRQARLMRETAMLPQMSPSFWREQRDEDRRFHQALNRETA